MNLSRKEAVEHKDPLASESSGSCHGREPNLKRKSTGRFRAGCGVEESLEAHSIDRIFLHSFLGTPF